MISPLNTDTHDLPLNTDTHDLPLNTDTHDLPLNTDTYDLPLSWLGTCTSIKSGGVRLVLHFEDRCRKINEIYNYLYFII